MSRITDIRDEMLQIHTVEDLTEAFEGIASMHIAKIRDRVVASKEFFGLLWPIYRGLRANPKERLKRPDRAKKGRNVFLVVTSEGKLASETVEKIVNSMVEEYSKVKNTDIIVIGSRGVEEVHRHGLPINESFHMPVSDERLNVSQLIRELDAYEKIDVFYQTYESLRVQKVARIELVSAVRALGKGAEKEADKAKDDSKKDDVEAMTSKDYIFEPSIGEIADYMESVMMGVALIQVIMESKLAGHAARFNAMNRAKSRASDLATEYRLQYYRAKRSLGDERVKELMKVVRTREHRWAS